jgi:hypothetical protein
LFATLAASCAILPCCCRNCATGKREVLLCRQNRLMELQSAIEEGDDRRRRDRAAQLEE